MLEVFQIILGNLGFEMNSDAIEAFKKHIISRGYEVVDDDWGLLSKRLKPIITLRSDVLLHCTSVTQELIFVCEGIAASVQTVADGDTQIARFFEKGQLCSNITSAWHQLISDDELVAMTDFVGVLIPFSMFRQEYMSSGVLSAYWREMVFETLLFDKDIVCVKTIRDVETRYRFLEERFEDVVKLVPAKHIARFLGITPEGLSRFLRNRDSELT